MSVPSVTGFREVNRIIREHESPSSRSYQLENSTTYSGADIRVFIYKDLASLLSSTTGTQDMPGGEIKVSDKGSPVWETLDQAVNAFEDWITGVEQKGSPIAGTGRSAPRKPTNITDLSHVNRGRSLQTSSGGQDKDPMAGFVGIDSIVRELGSLKGINYSSFREKIAVRGLGRVHAKGYTRGQRTIAGTLAFTVLQTHELLNFADASKGEGYHAMLDQIEPFHMLLLFGNEYGSMSSLHLFNVDIGTESQDMSIGDLETTNVMNFYATDMLPMTSLGNNFAHTGEMLNAAFSNNKDLTRVKNGLRSPSANTERIDMNYGNEHVQERLKRSRGLF